MKMLFSNNLDMKRISSYLQNHQQKDRKIFLKIKVNLSNEFSKFLQI
jgi:hypothetical protein